VNLSNFIRALSREINPPLFKEAREAIGAFTFVERFVFGCFLFIFIISAGVLVNKTVKLLMVEKPSFGGSLTEGLIGAPSFINPILAQRDVDRDLTSLIYSGLLKATPDGRLEADLAETYEISADGRQYTFILKKNLLFQDGQPLTADDVVFTIQKIQDPDTKSPRRDSFEGVEVEKIDERTVRFSLREPYTPFLENLTIGILPHHIWRQVESDQFPFSRFNLNPVGSGPYRLSKVSRDAADTPIFYELSANKKYVGGRPFIEKIIFRFYPNEKALITALTKGEIESVSAISPNEAKNLSAENYQIHTSILPRIFTVFLNQNQAPIFTDKAVREALNLTAPRMTIVNNVLAGFGQPIDSPVPLITNLPHLPREAEENEIFELSAEKSAALATSTLEHGGWKKNKEGIYEKKSKSGTTLLSFTIATSNTPELKATAEILKLAWEKIGAKVSVQIFELGDLNQNVIRPRKYDALLFGQVVSRYLDLFAFWHSSQRNDPGLNVALYTNISVDRLLEEIRTMGDGEARSEKIKILEQTIKKEIPAIFLYSPEFIYITPVKVKNITIKNIITPADRFIGIEKWFIKTKNVLEIFSE
jgi:peptide/nickel transport system substrate-binding protein